MIFNKKTKQKETPNKAIPPSGDLMVDLTREIEAQYPQWRSIKIRRDPKGISWVIDTGTEKKAVGVK